MHKGEDRVGIRLKELCTYYAQSNISYEHIEKLKQHGIDILEFIEDDDRYTINSFVLVNLAIKLIELGNSALKCKIVNIPYINICDMEF